MGQPRKPGKFPPSISLSLCVLSGFCGALFLFPGCGHDERRPVPSVFRSSARRFQPSARTTGRLEAPSAGVLAERSLKARGLRFGTDGTAGGLYAFVKYSHELVAPGKASPGDLVFFDLGTGRCGQHVGVVQSVDDDGRITFSEARDGEILTSHAHALKPAVRRGDDGRVLNTFLRPKRMSDPAGTRYFAGEMLCAVGRVGK